MDANIRKWKRDLTQNDIVMILTCFAEWEMIVELGCDTDSNKVNFSFD